MDPVLFKGHDRVLGAPAAWDQTDTACAPLAIKHTEVNGLPSLTSYWRPTLEELALLGAGAHVKFTLVGRGMPPVMIEIERCEEIG